MRFVLHDMMNVLLVYVIDYSGHVDVWFEWYACGLLVSLLYMCKSMRLHMHIALVGLD